MINEIYNRKILEFAADIPGLQRLDAPDATATALSRLCGSRVTVDLKMKDDVVTDFGQEVKACALGQASSSVMARHVIGSTAAELRKLKEQMYAMLKEGGPAPTGKWPDYEAFLPVRDFKARHASTLLTFDAVTDAIAQIEAKRPRPYDEIVNAGPQISYPRTAMFTRLNSRAPLEGPRETGPWGLLRPHAVWGEPDNPGSRFLVLAPALARERGRICIRRRG